MAATTIVEQFKSVPTTAISDATEGLNNLYSTIKPLKDTYKISGRALTVKMPVGDNLSVLKAIYEAKPGDIIVIDAKGDTYRAIAGDFILGLAKVLEIGGIVVDGVIRDLEACKALDFPVFCKGTTMAASGKAGIGDINVPISCGGVSIQPGDIIVGDCDGVTVVPQGTEEKILKDSLEKLEKDEKREASVSGDVHAVKKYLEEFIAKTTKA